MNTVAFSTTIECLLILMCSVAVFCVRLFFNYGSLGSQEADFLINAGSGEQLWT